MTSPMSGFGDPLNCATLHPNNSSKLSWDYLAKTDCHSSLSLCEPPEYPACAINQSRKDQFPHHRIPIETAQRERSSFQMIYQPDSKVLKANCRSIGRKLVSLPGLHQILKQLKVPYHSQGKVVKKGVRKLEAAGKEAMMTIAETAASLLSITKRHFECLPTAISPPDRKQQGESPPDFQVHSFPCAPSNSHGPVKSRQTHPHQCDHCPQVFTRRDNLKQHILSIHNGKRYPCDLCPKSFTQSGSLNLHVKTAHGGVRVKCDQCDKTYARLHGLKQHLMQAHGSVDATPLVHAERNHSL